MSDRGKNFGKCILPSILILVAQNVLALGGAFFVFCKMAHDYKSGSYFDFMEKVMKAITSTDFNVGVMLAYSVIGVTCFMLWYKKVFLQEKSMKFSISSMTQKPAYFLPGVVLFAFGMQYLCTYVMNILAVLFPHWLEQYENILEGAGLTGDITLPMLLYAVLLGPICEELAFRGLTMGYAKRFMSFWAANTVQAILFAGMHMNPLQGAYTFVVGLAFGYFVHRCGNLWMGILLHIAFNAFGVFGNALIRGGSNPVEMFFILFAAMVGTYLGFIMINRNIPETEKKSTTGVNQ